ncbi:CBS domain-containing protein CBSCBSPB3-like [Pyrus ussuriensis x Pyrus communis]|uniref:CBS domain-containing protein CBSCBSPB3-like n=1 Tax=Pyrus ussuriensis x Pyrus communis TaxID=2448454 RepID=A0A5N5HGB7_9ROSA|nr:CBS domain-containing protein CBSCBSPB3-like [Pyrus ussuriensis x Pyrus communis]
MSSQVGVRRTSLNQRRGPSAAIKKSPPPENGTSNGTTSKPSSPPPLSSGGGERTVKKLRLSKALTIPEGTTVSDACWRMAARRVDDVLLTDSNALLSGIVTDKDISARVIAEGLRPEQTIVSKIMTRNPIFVNSDSSALEALQKMIQGKFRHLPVVESGEVIALLDITKCLYDAISRLEKAAEQGSAIAAAVEGVECQMGGNFSAPYAFLETLRDQMFKPSLSTIIGENTKVVVVSPSDPVYVAAKRMREFRVNSVIIITGNKIQGVLTSKDILIDGCIAACLDVLQITHAAVSMDSALALEPPDDCDTQSELSTVMASDGADGKFSYPSLGLGDSFAFKFEDLRGRVHRINCGMENLDELVSAIMKRIRVADDHDHPHILFEDEDGDNVLLATDDDLISAVLRLHLDFSDSSHRSVSASGTTTTQRMGWTSLHTGVLASAAMLTGIGVLFYLKRTNL